MKRSRAPKTGKYKGPGDIRPSVAKLRNSVPVYMVSAGSQPVVKIDLMFKAGAWWQNKSLVASTVNAILNEGTIESNGEEIANRIDYYGSYLNTWSDRDNAFISLICLSKHIDSILPLLAEITRYPSFPERELNIYLQRLKQGYITEKTRVSSLAREKFALALFGGSHPYGKNIRIQDFSNLTTEDLFNFHASYYNSNTCRIIVSGRYDEQKMAGKLDGLFGGNDWKTGEFSATTKLRKNPSGEKRFIINSNRAVQSALRVGRELFNIHNPDYLGMMVLNSILGGHFGSRLMQNIREKKGYTYGIGSLLVSLRHSGFLTIVSEVGTGYGKAAIKEIYRELDKLRKKPVSKRELELTRSHMLGEMLRGFDGPFAWSESIRNLIEQDLDADYYTKLTNTIKEITPGDLQELAGKYLSPSDMYEVVAGNVAVMQEKKA